MKKNYNTLIFLFFIVSMNSQVQYNSFEGNTTLSISIVTSTSNIWQIGKPQKTLFSKASSTPNVIVTDTIGFYPKNSISTFSFGLSVFSIGITAVRWKQKLDCDLHKDGGIVEFSDDGTNWQNAHNNSNVYQFYGFMPSNKDTLPNNEYAFSGRDTTWRDIWLCFNTFNINPIYMRFTFKSDSINTNKEGWMIDNLMIDRTFFHPVKENSKVKWLMVYPNITSGIVNVEMLKNDEIKTIDNIELINEMGQTIETYGQNYAKVVLDVSKHPRGIYYLKVTINKKPSFHKIVYEKNN